MTTPDQPVHSASCRWEKTTPADCEYRATHHYCPHPGHACSCPPRACPAPGGHPLDLLAIAAYEAFRLATGDRLNMPPWDDLPPYGREDWRMVADAVQMAAAPWIRADERRRLIALAGEGTILADDIASLTGGTDD